MKYVVFTSFGEGLPIAKKLKDEGNWVLVAYKDKKDDFETNDQYARRMKNFDGLVSRMTADEAVQLLLNVPDKSEYFIWFDFNNMTEEADQLRDLGFKGNFPTEDDKKFEDDRDFAKDFVKKHYPMVKVAEVQEFQKKEDGIKFMEEHPEDIWVLKGNDDGAKTVVPTSLDPEIAKQEIQDALEDSQYEKKGFILELKITDPIEVTPEKVYWNGEPLFTNVDIENKKLGSGEIGPMTGCAQDLVVQTDMDCHLNEIAFPPIVDELAKQHQGMFIWDISLLFDQRTGQCYMGEFCPNRNGYNAFYSELAMLPRITDFFESVAKGKNPFDKSVGRFGASVRVFSLNRDIDMTPSQESIIINPEVERMVWLMDGCQKEDRLYQNGYWWNREYADILAVSCYGNSAEDAAARTYEKLQGVTFPAMFYRPLFDFISYDYATSIPNRLEYLTSRNIIKTPDGELVEGYTNESSPFYAKRKADEAEYEKHYRSLYEFGVKKNAEDYNGKIKEITKKVEDALNG